MKPRPHVQLQAIATLLVSATALVLLGHRAAIALAPALTLGGAIWLWFAARYRQQRKHWPYRRSASRAGSDGVMVQCLVTGLLIPAGLTWGAVVLGESAELFDPPVGDGLAVILALSAVLVPLSMLVSSSVDWYLIRPFREGVYSEPVCRSEVAESPDSVNYLKYWVMHRLVCEFMVWIAITFAIAFVTAIVEGSTDSDVGGTTLNLIGLLGILGWTSRELGKLRPAVDFVRYPSVGLGQEVTGRNMDGDAISGFVLDVSLEPGVQLIREPRGHPCSDISIPENSIPLRARSSLSVSESPRRRCVGRCEFWVPDCEVGLREQERLDAPAAV